jgi:uncharacterized membrane-anchored protein
MKTKYIIIAFILTVLAQGFVPAKMVYDSEMTERHGTLFKFRTEPVDPSDPFRGKYVVLNYNDDVFFTKDSAWNRDEKVYIVLKNDKEGFAEISDALHTAPKSGSNYIATTVELYDGERLHVNLPFNRFYMEEGKAQEAETAYRIHNSQDNAKATYGLVAVMDGSAVLKDVIIDDIPIKDYVLRKRKADALIK